MQCVGCKYPHTHVVRTVHDDLKNRNRTLRRRECLRCGLRFSTAESLKEPRKKGTQSQ